MSIFFAVDLDSFICKRQLFAGKSFHESFAFIFALFYMLYIYINIVQYPTPVPTFLPFLLEFAQLMKTILVNQKIDLILKNYKG